MSKGTTGVFSPIPREVKVLTEEDSWKVASQPKNFLRCMLLAFLWMVQATLVVCIFYPPRTPPSSLIETVSIMVPVLFFLALVKEELELSWSQTLWWFPLYPVPPAPPQIVMDAFCTMHFILEWVCLAGVANKGLSQENIATAWAAVALFFLRLINAWMYDTYCLNPLNFMITLLKKDWERFESRMPYTHFFIMTGSVVVVLFTMVLSMRMWIVGACMFIQSTTGAKPESIYLCDTATSLAWRSDFSLLFGILLILAGVNAIGYASSAYLGRLVLRVNQRNVKRLIVPIIEEICTE